MKKMVLMKLESTILCMQRDILFFLHVFIYFLYFTGNEILSPFPDSPVWYRKGAI